jgi:hypothetical protein
VSVREWGTSPPHWIGHDDGWPSHVGRAETIRIVQVSDTNVSLKRAYFVDNGGAKLFSGQAKSSVDKLQPRPALCPIFGGQSASINREFT